MRIDKALGITAPAESLEFVLIDPHNDTQLFIDPYKIEVLDTPIARRASKELHSFFRKLIVEAVSTGKAGVGKVGR